MKTTKIHVSIATNRIDHLCKLDRLNSQMTIVFTKEGVRVNVMEKERFMIATILIQKALFQQYEGVEEEVHCPIPFTPFTVLMKKGGVLHMIWENTLPRILILQRTYNEGWEHVRCTETMRIPLASEDDLSMPSLANRQWTASVSNVEGLGTLMRGIGTMSDSAVMQITVTRGALRLLYTEGETSNELFQSTAVQWNGEVTPCQVNMKAWVWMYVFNHFVCMDSVYGLFRPGHLQLDIMEPIQGGLPLRMRVVWEYRTNPQKEHEIVHDFLIAPMIPIEEPVSKKRRVTKKK